MATTAACAGTGDEAADDNRVDVAEQQAQLAASLGIDDPPEVDVIRIVIPEERGDLVASCLSEQGYGSGSGIPNSQLDAYDLAQFICLAQYPVEPYLTGPPTDEQIEIRYDWTINEVIPCLEERGYTIVDVPSREVFIETWDTDPFFPFSQIPPGSLSNDEMAELNDQCPQSPPSDVLFPGD